MRIYMLKNYIEWWKNKLGISYYALAWISFFEGVAIGLIIYHFLIK